MQLLDDEALDYSQKHLRYEASMFAAAVRELNEQSRSSPSVGRNLIVEAVYLHGRCLYDFLSPPKLDGKTGAPHYPNSVHACHFLTAWTFAPSEPARDFKKRANEELAHLTTKRRTSGDVSKQIDPQGPHDVWCAFRQFARDCPSNRLHPSVKAEAQETIDWECGAARPADLPILDSTAEIPSLDLEAPSAEHAMAIVFGNMLREKSIEHRPGSPGGPGRWHSADGPGGDGHED